MSTAEYGIQVERSLESMRVVERIRSDFGDLEALAQSMKECGLLQIPTITPEGVILLGERRYLAARLLGWRTMPVWVRSGLSNRLGLLLSRQADHLLQKPLNPIEAAAMYRELKTVLADEAAQRRAVNQFPTSDENGVVSGGRDSRPPETTPNQLGKSGRKAAELITGRDSSQMLERVCRIEDLANDPHAAESVRSQAQDELDRIRGGAAVHSAHLRMKAALTLDQLDQLAADPEESDAVREQARVEAAKTRQADVKATEMERLAQAALQRVKTSNRAKATTQTPPPVASRIVVRSSRAFWATWGELDSWWEHYDAYQLARELTEEQVDVFLRVSAGTTAFAERLQLERTALLDG